jgi:hypothetical protein
MTRREERVTRVRAVVDAARRVTDGRATIAAHIARATGLSPEGVELAFERHLELEPIETDVAKLVEQSAEAPSVHVILSANVFVGALRALAIARATSVRVTVRPSRRDPVFARALVEALGEPQVSLAEALAVAAIEEGEVHVYGRDETIALVREQVKPGVVVRGHGAGMGVALVSTAAASVPSAEAIAADVVAFDQRGCLSPRVVMVEGAEARALALAKTLSGALDAIGARIPRGALTDDERAQARRYSDSVAFGGEVFVGTQHLVGYLPTSAALLVPPTGRHVHVAQISSVDDARVKLGDLARHVVAVGTDDLARFAPAVPPHARTSLLGAMQRPPLDGPVDRRPQ